MKAIQDLIEISRYYGSQKDFTLAGGGNTSYKNEKFIWIKASGLALATINKEGFVKLVRNKLDKTALKEYNKDPHIREAEVKEDLLAAKADPADPKRPSVETSLHNLINYSFVVHLHPTIINSLSCSKRAEEITRELFGDKVMFVRYAAGYELFKLVQSEIITFRENFKKDPSVIFLRNHGIFVSADSIQEIKDIYSFLTMTIKSKLGEKADSSAKPVKSDIISFLPAMRMILSEKQSKILKIRRNALIDHFSKNESAFKKVSSPFTPDMVVYCKGKYLYIKDSSSPESIIKSFQKQLKEFKDHNNYMPSIILIKDYGLISVGDNASDADTILDIYEDLMKISWYSESFGGPNFMNDEDISFIENWEVEQYRRQVFREKIDDNIVNQKVIIITGGAQGFGKGIAEELTKKNANIILADLNEKEGTKTAEQLDKPGSKNQVRYINTDVSKPASVKNLMLKTVELFGGLDVLISNAGILNAGSLNEMDPDTFELVTKINYEGYFLTAKYASEILILQSAFSSDYFTDIIQINSKSGLQGSNKNFAYSGSKFGGIGLTQSFALELAPYRIKVNSICPGNYFEGPLWSDPKKGLFVQYLKTGKVPGAKTVKDVKQFYEKLVPMGRGCQVKDLMKAIYYVISQEYETGQAIPVTGGQVMLS